MIPNGLIQGQQGPQAIKQQGPEMLQQQQFHSQQMGRPLFLDGMQQQQQQQQPAFQTELQPPFPKRIDGLSPGKQQKATLQPPPPPRLIGSSFAQQQHQKGFQQPSQDPRVCAAPSVSFLSSTPLLDFCSLIHRFRCGGATPRDNFSAIIILLPILSSCAL